MPKNTSNRGGHRPAGWSNVSMDLSGAGLQHIGKRMASELLEAEQGAQFGSNGRKETVATGKVIVRPKSAQCFSRRYYLKAFS